MLISDNNVLSQAALRDYGSFPVPFNGIEFDKSENKSLAEIDRLISENKIGEIVNLSQKLNTIYWSIINTPDISIISPEELYKNICILAVLSNTEIDKAKRIYKVDVDSVLDELKAKYLGIFGKYFNEPEFWRYINISSGKPKSKTKTMNAAHQWHTFTTKPVPIKLREVKTANFSLICPVLITAKLRA